MLENLPAKRAPRQIFPELSPNTKINPALAARKQLLAKQKAIGNRGFKLVATSTTINSVGNNIALRKKRNVEGLRLIKGSDVTVTRRTRSSLGAAGVVAGKGSPLPRSSPEQSIKRDSRKGEQLSKALRRHTKAVVSKISNTFRRGNGKRMLNTSPSTKTTVTSATDGASNTDGKTKSMTKSSFLRTLSFRRSKRNAKEAELARAASAAEAIAESNEMEIEPTEKDGDVDESKPEQEEGPKESNEAKNSLDEGENKKLVDSMPATDEPKAPAEVIGNAIASNIPNKPEDPSDAPATVKEIPSTVDSSKPTETTMPAPPAQPTEPTDSSPSSKSAAGVFKRKKSLKSIINNIRHKCEQLQQSSEAPEVVLPPSPPSDLPVDLSVTATPPPTPSTTTPISEKVVEESVEPQSPDEPMNLSLKRRQSPLRGSIGSALSPPLLVLSPSLPLSSGASSPLSPLSPTSSTGSKKRTSKKINDCIAKLAGKLQEKLGVPFLEPSTSSMMASPPAPVPAKLASPTLMVVPTPTPTTTPIQITIPTIMDTKKPVTILSIPDLTARKEALEKKIAKDSSTKALRECRKEAGRKSKSKSNELQKLSLSSIEHRPIGPNDLVVPMLANMPAMLVITPIDKMTHKAHTHAPLLPLPIDIRTMREEARRPIDHKSSIKLNSELTVTIMDGPPPPPSQSLLKIVSPVVNIEKVRSPASVPPKQIVEMLPKAVSNEKKLVKLPEEMPISPPRGTPCDFSQKPAENSLHIERVQPPIALPLPQHDEPKKSVSDQTKPTTVETTNVIVSKEIVKEKTAIVAPKPPTPIVNSSPLDVLEDFEMNIASSVIEKQALIKQSDERQKAEQNAVVPAAEPVVNKKTVHRRSRAAANIKNKDSKHDTKTAVEIPIDVKSTENNAVLDKNVDDKKEDAVVTKTTPKKDEVKSTKSRSSRRHTKSNEESKDAVVVPTVVADEKPIAESQEIPTPSPVKKSPRKSKKTDIPEVKGSYVASAVAPVDEKVHKIADVATLEVKAAIEEPQAIEPEPTPRAASSTRSPPKSKSKKAGISTKSPSKDVLLDAEPSTPIKNAETKLETNIKPEQLDAEKPSKSSKKSKFSISKIKKAELELIVTPVSPEPVAVKPIDSTNIVDDKGKIDASDADVKTRSSAKSKINTRKSKQDRAEPAEKPAIESPAVEPKTIEKEPEPSPPAKSRTPSKSRAKQPHKEIPDIIPTTPITDDKEKGDPPEVKVTDKSKSKSNAAQRKSKAIVTPEQVDKSPVELVKAPPTAEIIEDEKVETSAPEQSPLQSKRKTSRSKPKSEKKSKVELEASDDELLPWDPEIGFVKNSTDSETKSATAADVDNSKTIVLKTDEASECAAEEPASASTPTPKIKKKRRNELAQIIADQLLESFKEVDESHLNELKKINDLTNCEDLLAVSFAVTPIPKRRAKQVVETATTAKPCAEEIPHVTEEKTIKKPPRSSHSRAKAPAVPEPNAKIADATEVTVTPSKSDAKNAKKDSSKKKKQQQPIAESIETESVSVTPTPTKTTPKHKTVAVNSRKGKKSTPRHADTSPVIAKDEPEAEAAATTTDKKNIFLAEFNKLLFIETIRSDNVDDDRTRKPTKSPRLLASKTTEKEVFGSSPAATKPVPDLVAQILDDFTSSSTAESKSSSSHIFTESIFTASAKTNSLSDLFNKSASSTSSPPSGGQETTILPPKNKLVDDVVTFDRINKRNAGQNSTFVSSMWDAVTDEKNDTKPTTTTENAVNFWSRNKDETTTEKASLFGMVKSKTKKIFDKITKRKLKRSLKSSISCSSSSSSSSLSSSPSHLAPKKPILRPSILSGRQPGDGGDVITVDVFDALKMSSGEPQKPVAATTATIISKPVLAEPVLSRKMGSIRRRGDKSSKSSKTTVIADGPKSPIESDMNIAKIAIALNSNRVEKLKQDESIIDKLNDAFRVTDKTRSSMRHSRHKKSKIEKSGKQHKTEEPTAIAPPTVDAILNDDSSQDTIISQIISKIRENADRREESDDDLCLNDDIKQHEYPTNEFAESSTLELSESRIDTNLSAIVSDINKRLESPASGHVSDGSATPLDSGLADGDDDDNTNTELVDMDLEDDVSVYTGISIDTSITSGGTNSENRKKKRKKKSIISRSRKAKRDNGFISPKAAIHHCGICNKSFRKPSALNSHKMTISHISKLSEQEFLDAAKKKEKGTDESTDVVEDLKQIVTDDVKLENKENVDVVAEKPVVLQKSPVHITLPQRSPPLEPHAPSPNHPNAFANQSSSAAETMSPSEQSPRTNTTPKPNAISNATATAAAAANSRLTLSQEERLFYECCSMLKGSERSNAAVSKGDQVSKPVTPKSNEQTNNNIAHSAQSPRSHPSPRPGIPNVDLDNFSDASSDSNPAYSCPHVPSSSKTQKASELTQTTSDPSLINFFKKSDGSSSNDVDIRRANSTVYASSALIVRNYPDTYSDMGDSFPSSQDASESEHYAQTILERSGTTLTVEALQKAKSSMLEPSAQDIIQPHSSFSNRYDHIQSTFMSIR